jgi:quercetin dioxygenase-like cupin family protein
MSLIRNIHKDGTPFAMGDTTSKVLIAPEVGARHVTFNYIRYAPHAEFPQHIHDHSEDVFLVLEGRGWLKEGEQLTPIGPGDVIFVPPGERHGTVAGPEGMVVVSCQGPPDLKLYTGERDSFRQLMPGRSVPQRVGSSE